MNLDELKIRLKEYKPEDIIFSHHAEIRLLQRNIPRKIMEDSITNPVNLIDFIEEEPERQKYRLIFELSHNRNLIVVAALGARISVITALIRYRKWMRPINLKDRKQ
ncbi:MAG: DUF4258 domain-containing protein [Candidatus Aenigmatarchaeota archaeon]